MSPPSFQQQHDPYHYHQHHHLPLPVKHEVSASVTTSTDKNNNAFPRMMSPSSLKIHKDSHMIKKSSSSSLPVSSGSPAGGSSTKAQQRGPVIIYTHSPKVIHTNPTDFMALVQKLTGMSSREGAGPTSKDNLGPALPKGEHTPPQPNHQHGQKFVNIEAPGVNNNNNNSSNSTDDNESSSVITDENCSSSTTTTGDMVGQLNPYVGPSMFEPLPPPPNLPLLMSSTSDMLCYNGDSALFYDYTDHSFPYYNHIT